MCTNQREIVNKYTGHKLFVKCGHCPACLQEKAAHRVSRIKFNESNDTEVLLVTLTYRRHTCPYVERDTAYLFSQGKYTAFNLDKNCELYMSLPVYRDVSCRKVRVSSNYDIAYKSVNIKHQICEIPFEKKCSFSNNKDLAHEFGKIGVVYYPDVQNFMARLRINLLRHFNFYGTFKTYITSEYGTKSNRPHFHLLLFIPKGTSEQFRNAIIESWPFSNLRNFPRAIEKAYRASSYVASYVNCTNKFPTFIKTYFSPKHSYSKGFGVGNKLFQLDKILSNFQRGHLTFFAQKIIENVPTIVECPIPKYVIHRFFPMFKGYNRIAPASLCQSMQRFRNLDAERNGIPQIVNERLNRFNRSIHPVYYDMDEVHKIAVRLDNAYQRFIEECSLPYKVSFEDYCLLHCSVWNLYHSDILRLHLSNTDVPIYEKYDNLEQIKIKLDSVLDDFKDYPMPIGFTSDMFLVTDPNKFASVIANTRKYTVSYYDAVKHRSVNNAIMSSQNEEF